LAAKVPPPREFAIQEKNANAWELAWGGAWAQLELTNALVRNYLISWKSKLGWQILGNGLFTLLLSVHVVGRQPQNQLFAK